MIRFFRHLGQLYGLASRMRRYGAIRALDGIDVIPDWAPMVLRFCTFYIPRKAGLPDADGERLAAALSHMGPAYIKLGQTLATRPDLVGQGLAKGLTTLQDRLPPFSADIARSVIEEELGAPLNKHFSTFEDEVIAAASIAQVHRAVTADGKPVAVKVVRPDIEKRFKRDLGLFAWLAELAENNTAEGRRLRLVSVVEKLRETFTQEMDLTMEAAHATELAENMFGEAGYRIPDVDRARSSSKILTIEWVDGIRLADHDALQAAGHDMEKLAVTVVQTFLRQAMRDGYFHADLHQGNLIVEKDGTIVAIDFGIMGRLGKKDRRFLAEILYGFINRNYLYVAQVHFDAGYVPHDQSVEEFASALRAIADPIMELPVEEISAGKLLAQLFATTERFSMQTQPQLLLLQRTMMMAEGMALHLNPKTNMWQTSEPVIKVWMQDNLSLEARLADMIRDLPRLLERLPAALDALAEPQPPSVRAPKAPGQDRFRYIIVIVAAFAAGYLFHTF